MKPFVSLCCCFKATSECLHWKKKLFFLPSRQKTIRSQIAYTMRKIQSSIVHENSSVFHWKESLLSILDVEQIQSFSLFVQRLTMYFTLYYKVTAIKPLHSNGNGNFKCFTLSLDEIKVKIRFVTMLNCCVFFILCHFWYNQKIKLFLSLSYLKNFSNHSHMYKCAYEII